MLEEDKREAKHVDEELYQFDVDRTVLPRAPGCDESVIEQAVVLLNQFHNSELLNHPEKIEQGDSSENNKSKVECDIGRLLSAGVKIIVNGVRVNPAYDEVRRAINEQKTSQYVFSSIKNEIVKNFLLQYFSQQGFTQSFSLAIQQILFAKSFVMKASDKSMVIEERADSVHVKIEQDVDYFLLPALEIRFPSNEENSLKMISEFVVRSNQDGGISFQVHKLSLLVNPMFFIFPEIFDFYKSTLKHLSPQEQDRLIKKAIEDCKNAVVGNVLFSITASRCEKLNVMFSALPLEELDTDVGILSPHAEFLKNLNKAMGIFKMLLEIISSKDRIKFFKFMEANKALLLNSFGLKKLIAAYKLEKKFFELNFSKKEFQYDFVEKIRELFVFLFDTLFLIYASLVELINNILSENTTFYLSYLFYLTGYLETIFRIYSEILNVIKLANIYKDNKHLYEIFKSLIEIMTAIKVKGPGVNEISDKMLQEILLEEKTYRNELQKQLYDDPLNALNMTFSNARSGYLNIFIFFNDLYQLKDLFMNLFNCTGENAIENPMRNGLDIQVAFGHFICFTIYELLGIISNTESGDIQDGGCKCIRNTLRKDNPDDMSSIQTTLEALNYIIYSIVKNIITNRNINEFDVLRRLYTECIYQKIKILLSARGNISKELEQLNSQIANCRKGELLQKLQQDKDTKDLSLEKVETEILQSILLLGNINVDVFSSRPSVQQYFQLIGKVRLSVELLRKILQLLRDCNVLASDRVIAHFMSEPAPIIKNEFLAAFGINALIERIMKIHQQAGLAQGQEEIMLIENRIFILMSEIVNEEMLIHVNEWREKNLGSEDRYDSLTQAIGLRCIGIIQREVKDNHAMIFWRVDDFQIIKLFYRICFEHLSNNDAFLYILIKLIVDDDSEVLKDQVMMQKYILAHYKVAMKNLEYLSNIRDNPLFNRPINASFKLFMEIAKLIKQHVYDADAILNELESLLGEDEEEYAKNGLILEKILCCLGKLAIADKNCLYTILNCDQEQKEDNLTEKEIRCRTLLNKINGNELYQECKFYLTMYVKNNNMQTIIDFFMNRISHEEKFRIVSDIILRNNEIHDPLLLSYFVNASINCQEYGSLIAVYDKLCRHAVNRNELKKFVLHKLESQRRQQIKESGEEKKQVLAAAEDISDVCSIGSAFDEFEAHVLCFRDEKRSAEREILLKYLAKFYSQGDLDSVPVNPFNPFVKLGISLIELAKNPSNVLFRSKTRLEYLNVFGKCKQSMALSDPIGLNPESVYRIAPSLDQDQAVVMTAVAASSGEFVIHAPSASLFSPPPTLPVNLSADGPAALISSASR